MLERILIVGLGSIGKRHAKIVRELLPNAKIAALRHQALPQPHPIDVDLCFNELEDALRFRPDAAVIANPAPLHLDCALPLAHAGVNLLIEKPIGSDATRVQELIDTCHANHCTLMTGYNLRFLPTLAAFRDLILSGQIGRILSVRAEVGQYLPDWRPDTDYRTTVSSRKALGGGVLLELSHEIDYLRWIFGDIDWVSAVVTTQSELEIDVEDSALLTLGFKHENKQKQLIASLNIDFIRRDPTRKCTVIGEQGTLVWDGIASSVCIFEATNPEWKTLHSNKQTRNDSYISEWKHFIKCIAQNEKALISGEDGLYVLNVIQAARESSSQRKRIEIP